MEIELRHEDSKVGYIVLFVFKRSLVYVTQEWRGVQSNGTPAMTGDNDLYLLMTRVVRSWSMRLGLTCTTHCLLYCEPCTISWLGAHFCSALLTYSMSSCDCFLLISLCGCVVVLQQLFPVSRVHTRASSIRENNRINHPTIITSIGAMCWSLDMRKRHCNYETVHTISPHHGNLALS